MKYFRDVILPAIAVVVLLYILLQLTGCATTYHAERTEAGITTVLDVRSYREFPGGIEIEYDRERGVFVLKAGDVQDGGGDAVRDVALGLLPLISAPDGN